MPTRTTPFSYSIRVHGLRPFIAAADAGERDSRKLVRTELREAARPVRDEAERLFEPVSSESASTYGISVRRVGTVSVEQRRRKTTGERPDWGRLQMREALLPALENKAGEVESRLEAAVDRICDRFERSGSV